MPRSPVAPFNPGQGMQAHVNHALTVVLEVLVAWTELSEEEQQTCPR